MIRCRQSPSITFNHLQSSATHLDARSTDHQLPRSVIKPFEQRPTEISFPKNRCSLHSRPPQRHCTASVFCLTTGVFEARLKTRPQPILEALCARLFNRQMDSEPMRRSRCCPVTRPAFDEFPRTTQSAPQTTVAVDPPLVCRPLLDNGASPPND